MIETLEDWRDFRGYSPRQAEAADLAISRKRVFMLYGGAGFGGKSYLLRQISVELNGRLLDAGFPNQWGALICKVGEDLKKRHIGKLEDELGQVGVVKEDHKRGLHFRFHDPQMGGFYLLHLEDADRYRSAEFAWVLGDEITEWTRDDFGKVLYALRSPLNLPFMPFIGGSNPDGPHHAWVRKLWIDREFTDGDSEFNPDDFVFIKALPTDNPHWNPEMESTQFAGLSENVRKARLSGSWDFVGNARFPQFDRDKHVFDFPKAFPKGLPDSWIKYRSVDWGFAVPYCCLWAAVDTEGNVWVYREDYAKGVYTWEQPNRILSMEAENEKIYLTYMGPENWNQIANPMGVHQGMTNAGTYQAAGVYPLAKGNNKRKEGWNTIDTYLSFDNGHPNLYIERSCTNLVRTLAALPIDMRTPLMVKREDVDPMAEDHAPEALRLLLHTRLHPTKEDKGIPDVTASEEVKQEALTSAMDEFWRQNDRKSQERFTSRLRGRGRF